MYIPLSPKTTAKGIYYVYTKLTLTPFLANLDESFPFFFFIPLKSEHIDNLLLVVFQIVNHDIIFKTIFNGRIDSMVNFHFLLAEMLICVGEEAVFSYRQAFPFQFLIRAIRQIIYMDSEF